MIKKNVVFFLIVVIGVTILGQMGKSKFKDQGLCDVDTLDDLKGYSYSFESIDSEGDISDYQEYEDEYISDYEDCGYVFTAFPTGKYKMGTSAGMQEIEITRVIRGEEELQNAHVWIDGMPGLAYYEEENTLRIDALLNFMQEGNEYLIFCDAYGPVSLEEQKDYSKYYATDGIFGYLNITERENTGMIATACEDYTFNELKGYEFFGTCQSVLDEKQRIKIKLIEKYLENKVEE